MSGSNSSPQNQKLVLPHYTLESSLVLLPGILYNLTLSRFKAAVFFARYKGNVGHMPIVKNVLAEYDFDTASDTPRLSKAAFTGIGKFHSAVAKSRGSLPGEEARISKNPSSEMDWLVVAIAPNTSRIMGGQSTGLGTDEKTPKHKNPDIATVCRVVGITDESSNIKLTLQAIVRARRMEVDDPKTCEAKYFVLWSDKQNVDIKPLLDPLRDSTAKLFASIDTFVGKYRKVLEVKGEKPDLLTLNPLANALFLILAGSKDFEKAYGTLQKICDSGNAIESSRGLSRMIDLIAAVSPFPSTEKLQILSDPSVQSRATAVNAMVLNMSSVIDVIGTTSLMATRWFNAEASNMQKAGFVANQLKSIRNVLEGLTSKTKAISAGQKNLVRRKKNIHVSSKVRSNEGSGNHAQNDDIDDNDDDDELQAVAHFIKFQLPKISSISEDSKRLLVKDYRRIKNSPPGNADFHVVRNYLEIVADMPWDKYVARFQSNKDIDIAEAKKSLDDEHYGSEQVKTRLIQYLVVLKLLGASAEKEYALSGAKEADSQRHLREQKEKCKFTREYVCGESLISPACAVASSPKADVKFNGATANGVGKDRSQNDKAKNTTQETERTQTALIASKNNKSPIIMLAGPPGVGKTSLAKSIAQTLGRRFQKISLGGVRDESEIRGHRRTYIGAMAGSIVQALRKAQSMNPVILLDEIDKIIGGHNTANKVNGDPAAALLEVLDPEQNTQFTDHYLGFPIDLSQVIFICTANDTSNLSRPLLDRLEMIELGAYDYNEKSIIAQKYLLPRQMKRNGFSDDDAVVIRENVLKRVILDYTREAGVRSLERCLGTICRFKAVEYSESLVNTAKTYQSNVDEFDLASYLGLPFPNLSNDVVDTPLMSSNYGVVNGMSFNTDGSGSVLIFESIGLHNDTGVTSLNMTGRLGDVLMESAKIGLTFIRNSLYKHILNLEDSDAVIKKLNSLDIHMHVPCGAVQKDGPSAGITMALSFLSLILEKPVPSTIAMTGEITLRGLVLPIGGLKEKILGAHLTGQIEKVIVPRQNRRDILEEYVHKINDLSQLNGLLKDNQTDCFQNTAPEDFFAQKYGVKIVYAKEFWDVIKHVWGSELLTNVDHARLQEYHL